MNESKSGKMREMFFEKNETIGTIAKTLNVRYQFVYNVISREKLRRENEKNETNETNE
jgi:hypothetical protein